MHKIALQAVSEYKTTLQTPTIPLMPPPIPASQVTLRPGLPPAVLYMAAPKAHVKYRATLLSTG